MKLKAMRLATLSLILLGARPALPAGRSKDACELAPELASEVVDSYPNAKVVTLGDLTPDNKKFFQEDHHSACPGLAEVDFYGDGKPTLALVLATRSAAGEMAYLLVAQKVGAAWKIKVLDTADGAPTPVVWIQPPGKYEDVYGEKEIRATRPVIVFTGYEAWSIVYAWTGKTVSKVWIED